MKSAKKERAQKAKGIMDQIQTIIGEDKGWGSEEEMLADMARFRKERLMPAIAGICMLLPPVIFVGIAVADLGETKRIGDMIAEERYVEAQERNDDAVDVQRNLERFLHKIAYVWYNERERWWFYGRKVDVGADTGKVS